MISPQEILYFVECAKAGNLSRAAERLGVTQPTLTVALRKLEVEIGSPLFHRSKQGIHITKAGEILLQESKTLLSQWQRITHTVQRASQKPEGSYTIGCHPSVALYSLPQVIPQMLADFPQLKIELRHDLSRKIVEQIISSEIDLGICVNPVRHPDLIIKPLCKDRVSFYTGKINSPNNQLGKNGTVLIANLELNQTQTLLKKSKTTFPRILSTTSLEVIGSLTEAGAGIGILPSRVASHWKKIKPLTELPVFEDEVALLYRVENRSNEAFHELAKRIEKGMHGNL